MSDNKNTLYSLLLERGEEDIILLDGSKKVTKKALLKDLSSFEKSFFKAFTDETKEVIDAGNAIEEALSAPTRNCDVGTVEALGKTFDYMKERFAK